MMAEIACPDINRIKLSDSSDEKSLLDYFSTLISQDFAVPVAAMITLVSLIKNSKATTWMRLEIELRHAVSELKQCKTELLRGRTSVSLGTGCDLFMKYVTRAFSIDSSEFDDCKRELLNRGQAFTGMSLSARSHIAEIGHSFVQDNCTVLIHGYSRVVTALLLEAAKSKQFNIIVTEGRPQCDGSAAAAPFKKAGIPTSLIPDCAVCSVMDVVDLCIVGAEGVMENGGIVNMLGTYQIAVVAKALKKPFYVAVESYKFARMYPLNQKDAAEMCRRNPISSPGHVNIDRDSEEDDELSWSSRHHSTIDFTPAEYITLLFTDLGVLTPAAVSDELIKLYQ